MIVFKKAFGKSKGGYYHLPLLGLSFGRNGVMLTIFGVHVVIKRP